MVLIRRVFIFLLLFFVIAFGGVDMLFGSDWEKIDSLNPLAQKADKSQDRYSLSEYLLMSDDLPALAVGKEVLSGRLTDPTRPNALLLWRLNDGVPASYSEKSIIPLSEDFRSSYVRRSSWVDGRVLIATLTGEANVPVADAKTVAAGLFSVDSNGEVFEIDWPGKIESTPVSPVMLSRQDFYLFPAKRSIFFETKDGGDSWVERHLPPGYARLKGIERFRSGNTAIQPKTQELFLSGHFRGVDGKSGSSPIYRLDPNSDASQGWSEVARLEGYDINAMTFLDNGDLLILAYEGDRPENNDHREAQIFRWDGDTFEHLADLGNRRLFDPKPNTNLSTSYFVAGRDGLVVINGTSFKNKNGDLPVYNVSYVSHDYGHTWERQDNGVATGSVWFDAASGYFYKTTPFASYKRRP